MYGYLLTHLLCYGGALVAIFNPLVGVCLYWAFDIIRPQYMFSWSGTSGPFSLIIATATLIGWAAKGFGSWRLGKGSFIFSLLIFSSIWTLLSTIVAPNKEIANAYLGWDLKRLLMFTVAITTATSVPRLIAMASVIVASAGYVAFELNLQYLRGYNEAQFNGYGGMDNNCLAISMIACLAVAVFLGLHLRSFWLKWLAFAAAAFIGHTVLMTFSRGGLIGLIVSASVAFIVVPKRPRNLVAVAAAIVVGVMLTGPELRERFMSSFVHTEDLDESAGSRLQLWKNCFTVMREYPLLGAGPDHFPLISEEFGWPEGKEAHSLWLQLGAEVGIPGLVVLLLFYFMTIWRMWSYCRVVPTNEDERWTQTARAMIVTSLAGFMTSAQFVSLEGLETPLYVAAIALGTLRLVTARQVADSTVLNPAPVTVRSMPSAAGAGFSVPSPAPAGSTSRPLWPQQ